MHRMPNIEITQKQLDFEHSCSLMPLRRPYQAPELRTGVVGAQRWIAHHVARAGRRCTQRSGIKGEAAAIGRHGGQPRS
jgi:hypothetical protein